MNLFDDEQQAAKARRDAQFEKARADIQLGADRLDQGRTVDGDIFFTEWDAELDELESASRQRST